MTFFHFFPHSSFLLVDPLCSHVWPLSISPSSGSLLHSMVTNQYVIAHLIRTPISITPLFSTFTFLYLLLASTSILSSCFHTFSLTSHTRICTIAKRNYYLNRVFSDHLFRYNAESYVVITKIFCCGFLISFEGVCCGVNSIHTHRSNLLTYEVPYPQQKHCQHSSFSATVHSSLSLFFLQFFLFRFYRTRG